MSNKYKFRLSETNWIEFTQEDYDNAKEVRYYNDMSKGKILSVRRQFDNETYYVIVPIQLIEEIK